MLYIFYPCENAGVPADSRPTHLALSCIPLDLGYDRKAAHFSSNAFIANIFHIDVAQPLSRMSMIFNPDKYYYIIPLFIIIRWCAQSQTQPRRRIFMRITHAQWSPHRDERKREKPGWLIGIMLFVDIDSPD